MTSAAISQPQSRVKCQSSLSVPVAQITQLLHRRQRGKALFKALHPPALLVHGDQQLRRDGSDFCDQCLNLLATLDIAGK